MSDEYVKKIVIVGGGTAGWLTAGVIASDLLTKEKDKIQITLIESEALPPVGVGEGTWPSMRSTLRRIGISESELLSYCQVSLKQGSRFLGWYDGSSIDNYLHPFEPPPNEDDIDWHSLWKYGRNNFPYASAVSVANEVCSRNLAPKQKNTPEYAGVTNYAYHLDATSFAELLKKHCLNRLDVSHIVGEVTDIHFKDNGYLESLELKDREHQIQGDMFIDCSGLNASLISKCDSSSIVDVSDTMINDRALVVQVPYHSEDCELRSQTDSTAVEAGWIWDIALQSRRGVGYVYSSSHGNEMEAHQSLSRYLNSQRTGNIECMEDARLIKFRSQFRTKPWVRNLLAIGLSQGFVEPLEASSIVMIELAASYIRKILPFSKAGLDLVATQFNQRFEYRWRRIIEFLKLHYVLSKRKEPYWRDHRENSTIPSNLAFLLEKWRYSSPVREDFTDALEIFTAASYAYVLYGMGYETMIQPYRTSRNNPEQFERITRQLNLKREKLVSSLPTNRDLLNLLSNK